MFLDTHCHLSTIKQKDIELTDLLENLAKEEFSFILDIGTHCDDLDIRKKNVEGITTRNFWRVVNQICLHCSEYGSIY